MICLPHHPSPATATFIRSPFPMASVERRTLNCLILARLGDLWLKAIGNFYVLALEPHAREERHRLEHGGEVPSDLSLCVRLQPIDADMRLKDLARCSRDRHRHLMLTRDREAEVH